MAELKKVTLYDVGLAALLADVRADIDAVLEKHNVRLHFAWEGKRALLSLVHNDHPTRQLLLVECRKDKGAYYVTQAQELVEK